MPSRVAQTQTKQTKRLAPKLRAPKLNLFPGNAGREKCVLSADSRPAWPENSAQKASEETFRARWPPPELAAEGGEGINWCSGGPEVYYKGGTSFRGMNIIK